MSQMWWLRSTQERDFFNEHIGRLILAGKKPRVKFVEEDRSTDQNALSFALYKQIAGQLDDQSINDIRAECKLTVGVRLLRASDEGFNEFYCRGLIKLTYEEKIQAMEYVPVTSLMGKKVFSEYLDEVTRKYSQSGLSLLNPMEQQNYG